MDFKLSQKYDKSIGEFGFTKTKDVLGIYYTKTVHKISAIKNGSAYICYYNQFRDNQWVLLARSNAIMDTTQVLQWIYEKASKAL